MSSLEANKQIALDFFAALGRGDREAMRALVHDELRWVVPDGAILHAGLHEGASRVFDDMLSAVDDTFTPGSNRSEIGLVVAEGDIVMIEARINADAKDGRHYDNGYVFVFEFEGGRIRELREHVDTRYAADFYG
jgi:ketosteroid isomerase-like protein